MNVFAIGDLHLSLAKPNKEMDVFGSHWENHFARISEDWRARVGEDDVVLIPGDISWAMRPEEAQPDLAAIGALPGKKLLLRGNHDYWWSSAAKVEAVLGQGTRIIQNNCVEEGGCVFCGSRGWALPTDGSFSEEDRKIYEREKIRLRLSLDCAKKKGKPIVAMTHFPPLYEDRAQTEFAEMFEAYGVREVVFGHLHGSVLNDVHLADFTVNGVRYNLVSADYMDFRLKQVI